MPDNTNEVQRVLDAADRLDASARNSVGLTKNMIAEAREALAHQHQEGTGVGEAVEQRVCDDCGEEVELGSDGPWHCRMCGPRDEDETHVESVPATPQPQQEVDVEGAGRFEQLAQRFDKLRELQSLLDLADSMQPATSPTEQGGEVAE